jgi:hypothetical protein
MFAPALGPVQLGREQSLGGTSPCMRRMSRLPALLSGSRLLGSGMLLISKIGMSR